MVPVISWHRSVHLCSMGMYIHHKWVCPKQHITNFYFSPIQSWLSILYIRTVHKNTRRNKLQLATKPYYVTMSGAYKLGNNANYTIASSDGWLICTPLYWDAYIVETVKKIIVLNDYPLYKISKVIEMQLWKKKTRKYNF